MIFAERLRELRVENDLTQDELARATSLSHGCIAMLETNKRAPSGSTIIALAEFFEVTTDYLLGLEDEIGVKKFSAPVRNEKNAELTPDGKELLEIFNALGTQYKAQVLEYARYFYTRTAQQKKKI